MDREHRVGRRLKLRHMEILVAVVETGSMAKAGAKLAISQPAISRAIAEMEHTLGVPIFDRSPKGVEPTQYGRALLKRGIAAFDEVAQAVKDIDFLADPSAGELWIGSAPGLAEGIAFAVIDRLSQRYPRVVIHVVPGGLHVQHDALRARRIEFGFAGTTGQGAADDIEAEMLYEEPLLVVVGRGSAWTRKRTIKLAELVDEPWTWPAAGTVIDSLVVEAFRANGVEPPRARIHAEAYSLRIKLAATGRFLAIVPASIMRFPGTPSSIRVLPVDLPTTRRQIGIVTLKNRTLSPLAQLFIQCARDVARALVKARPRGSDSSTISLTAANPGRQRPPGRT
jgi:DNA-binding transcriptional LysR family regulator